MCLTYCVKNFNINKILMKYNKLNIDLGFYANLEIQILTHIDMILK